MEVFVATKRRSRSLIQLGQAFHGAQKAASSKAHPGLVGTPGGEGFGHWDTAVGGLFWQESKSPLWQQHSKSLTLAGADRPKQKAKICPRPSFPKHGQQIKSEPSEVSG